MPLLPEHYLDAVVSIERFDKNKIEPIATGFLVGFFKGEFDENKNKLYKTFLVTNRHVFEGKQEVTLRFNTTDTGFKRYRLILRDGEKDLWFAHQNQKVDIAIMPASTKYLREKEGIKCYFFGDDEDMAFINDIKKLGISQGDEVFVLGFPMGIVGEERNYVIVRSGIIARLDDEIISSQAQFLIDSFIFPGNSGGPVILKPTIISLEGTEPVKRAYLLGVIRSYLTYRDEAISLQTGETRIIFVENAGLAGVVPLDFVRETIERYFIESAQIKQ